MIIYGRIKTTDKTLTVDSVLVKTQSGKEIRLTWDETDIAREENCLSFRGKGIYFDDEYANGKISSIKDCEVLEVIVESNEGSGTIPLEDLVDLKVMDYIDLPTIKSVKLSRKGYIFRLKWEVR